MRKIPLAYSYKYNKPRSTSSYISNDESYINGNLTVSGNINGNITSQVGSARQLAPSNYPTSGSPHVTTIGDAVGSTILTFQTGSRNYIWRIRARGNGAGAEIYLEYYKGNGAWGTGVFSTDYKNPVAYKDAKGGDDNL